MSNFVGVKTTVNKAENYNAHLSIVWLILYPNIVVYKNKKIDDEM